jgi:uncharacterized protein with PQ loop repeat
MEGIRYTLLMQKTLQSTASVSLLFFVVFGGLHISASLLLAEGITNRVDTLFFNALDLPFLLAALVYGTSRFSLALEGLTGNLKTPLLICSSVSLVLFLGALYFNFGLSDANLL